jgi:broad specificity phosphatase PhoE
MDGERFDEVLVSTARRARRTAAPLLETVQADRVAERAWMHEIHMPASWQGTPAEEVGRAMAAARDRPGRPGGTGCRAARASTTSTPGSPWG